MVVLAACQTRQGKTQNRVTADIKMVDYYEIQAGAERTELYFPVLEGKSIGLVCNHSSLVNGVHLADTLIKSGFHVKVIFSPEHGFRGETEAGAGILDGTDIKTGTKIISLYGKKKKPSPEDLKEVDILLFDIQDAGVRFYTYISTLTGVMEAAAGQGIPLIVTDRPNPNGFYVDGPVLDTLYKSFVGMHPVPVVYGMTIGEYALMVNGEGWIGENRCDLTVIPLKDYTRNMLVRLEVRPSPNLPTWQSVYLYPSLCLFEGTMVSVGRGTEEPFHVIGHPGYRAGSFVFTPVNIPGVSEKPPFEGQICHGVNLKDYAENFSGNDYHFNLRWLISMHDYFKDTPGFFNSYFDKLAGNDRLRKDILKGTDEKEIRRSWEDDLAAFRKIRVKYLLYP